MIIVVVKTRTTHTHTHTCIHTHTQKKISPTHSYAGTSNPAAASLLRSHILLLIKAKSLCVEATANNTWGNLARASVESCLCIVALGLSLVMAGSGDLQTLKLLRGRGGCFIWVGGFCMGRWVLYGWTGFVVEVLVLLRLVVMVAANVLMCVPVCVCTCTCVHLYMS